MHKRSHIFPCKTQHKSLHQKLHRFSRNTFWCMSSTTRLFSIKTTQNRCTKKRCKIKVCRFCYKNPASTALSGNGQGTLRQACKSVAVPTELGSMSKSEAITSINKRHANWTSPSADAGIPKRRKLGWRPSKQHRLSVKNGCCG